MVRVFGITAGSWSLACVAVWSSAVLGGGSGEISIGRTADNRLIADLGFEPPLTIPRSVFPGFPGYTTGTIGWENVPIDDVLAGVLMLSPQSNISARLVSIDPGVAVYGGSEPLAVGESIEFGPPFFDFHPLYTIPDPLSSHGETFVLRFILHDASGVHLDSDPFDIILTPACHADLDDGTGTGTRDDSVDVGDLLYFLGQFEVGSGGVDLDNGTGTGIADGGVDISDLLYFLSRFELGC